MNIKNMDVEGGKIKFNISGIDVSLANALRRTVISQIPTMAVEEVTFHENFSIIDDEVLALRLGLIPLKTDTENYSIVSECSCGGEGCSKCTVILTLAVKGPGTVYSEQIKSTDPKVTPVYDKIPLVELTKDQEIKLEAKAQLGLGKEHMKWQSGLASYEMKDDGSFNFFVESFGQFEVRDLVDKAFDVFNKKISELEIALKKIK